MGGRETCAQCLHDVDRLVLLMWASSADHWSIATVPACRALQTGGESQGDSPEGRLQHQ